MDKPIQFIEINKDGSCMLSKEAEELITGINEKIAVICVAGLYRTGKSYLLNRLLGRQDGFEIGPTTNSCTKGIWIWGEPISIEGHDFKVLLIDTEGLGSAFEDRNETIDMEIFCLGVLLSSLFIYNSMKNIDEVAIESLAMVINFAKKIQTSFNELDNYSINFPSFLWVLRDFSLDLIDPKGRPISSSEYLENSLKIESDLEFQNEEIIKKNEIRRLLKLFFKERDCCTLIRPVSDEKKLRYIDQIPQSELRPEFLNQMQGLVKRIFNSLRPKQVQGSYLNGKMFINLVKMYIESINNNSIPDVKTSWKIVVEQQMSKIFDKIQSFYIDEMLSIDIKNVKDIEELLKHHTEIKSIAMDYLYEFNHMNVPTGVLLDLVRNLEEKLSEQFNIFHLKWKELSVAKCNSISQEILKETKNNNEENDLYTNLELFEKVCKFIEDSIQNSKKHEIIYPKIIEFFVENIGRGYRENKNKYDNEIKILRHDKNMLQGVSDKTKEILDKERDEHKIQLDSLKDEMLSMRLDFEARLDEKTRLLNMQKNQNLDMEEEYLTKITNLSTQIENQKKIEKDAKKKKRSSMNEGMIDIKIDNVIEKLDSFKDIFIKTELERAKLQLQIEINSRIEEVEAEFNKKLFSTKKLCEKTILKLKNSYQDQIRELKDLIKELYDEINDFKCQVSSQEYKIELYKEKIITYEKEKKSQTDHAELLRILVQKLNVYIDSMSKK